MPPVAARAQRGFADFIKSYRAMLEASLFLRDTLHWSILTLAQQKRRGR